jgi:hypothetical protein
MSRRPPDRRARTSTLWCALHPGWPFRTRRTTTWWRSSARSTGPEVVRRARGRCQARLDVSQRFSPAVQLLVAGGGGWRAQFGEPTAERVQRDGNVQILVCVNPDGGGGDHRVDGRHDGDVGLLLAGRRVGVAVGQAGGQDCDEAPDGGSRSEEATARIGRRLVRVATSTDRQINPKAPGGPVVRWVRPGRWRRVHTRSRSIPASIVLAISESSPAWTVHATT